MGGEGLGVRRDRHGGSAGVCSPATPPGADSSGAVTGDYFKGRESLPVWALLGVLLLLVMIDVRLVVLFTYQSNDQFSALQVAFEGEGDCERRCAYSGFWVSI